MSNKKKHISFEERFLIEKMLRKKSSISSISELLERGVSTVSKEISSNGGIEGYSANRGEEYSKQRQSLKKKNDYALLKNTELRYFVLSQIKTGLSPERISGITKSKEVNHLNYISAKAIRKYLNFIKYK